jgi:anti-sigma-K factor RskA
MAVALFDTQNSAVTLPQQVAVMQSEQADTLWLIEVNENTIDVVATRKLTPVADKDFELWIVAKGVENPISLGLLPQSGKLSLPKHAQFDAMDIVALAVSIEPLNGSPNGLPTKVLYTAQLAIL